MIWAILFAFWILKAGEGTPIYAIFQTLMAFFQGPALAVILCGFLWKRANGAGAVGELGEVEGAGAVAFLFVLARDASLAGREVLGERVSARRTRGY